MSVLYVRDESGKLVPIYTIKGEDGKTPYIQDGYWYIGDENTGVKADGTGVDKIKSIDTWWDIPYELEDNADGIYWKNEFALLDEDGNKISSGEISQMVPLMAGENVTFERSDDGIFFKINATGGGSSTPSVSLIGTWTVIEDPEIPESDIPLEFTSNGFEFTKITTGTAGPDFWGIKNLKYSGDKAEIGAYVNNPSGSNGITHGWIDEAYRYITVTKEPESREAIAWLGNNTDAPKVKLEKEQMPQIRFANFTEYKNEEDMTMYRFTVENLGGGTLQAGDKLQICCRRKYPGGKKKLRKMTEYEITEEDINQRFLKIEVDPNRRGGAEKWLFRNDRKEGDTLSAMYFRLKRVTKYSDSDGMECDAIFSNVETVWKTYLISYDEDGKKYSLKLK